MYRKYFLILAFFLACIGHINGTLSKSNKKARNKDKWLDEYDDLSLDVESFLRTVETEGEASQSRKFNNKVLGYVTPWNKFGYDVVKNYTKKFDIISPVWLQFVLKDNKVTINGEHDINQEWINIVRKKNQQLKIVPRLIMENWTPEYLFRVLQNGYTLAENINMIKTLINKYNFDGIVLEMWLQLGVHVQPYGNVYLKHIYEELHAMGKLLIFVLPPPVYAENQLGAISMSDVEAMMDHVDYFSLMTYDFSRKSGPNSPVKWMRQCINLLSISKSDLRSKMLLGLNFYGYLYGPRGQVRSIVRHELLDLLRKSNQSHMFWDKEHKEHYFKIKFNSAIERIIWYPTQQSIDLRLKLAKRLGVGVAIWELGQGLSDFYSVF